MSSDAVALPRAQRGVLADLVATREGHEVLWRDVALVVGAAGFLGALAQVSIPFSPVPITGQTLGVLLAACALGWRRAFCSMALYLCAGIVGLPWFAEHSAHWPTFSGGYLIGFVLAALVCGRLAETGSDRSVWRSVPTMLVGEACIYAVGIPWLKVAAGESWSWAFHYGFTVFIGPDAIKLAFAALLLPATWRLVKR